MQVQDQANLSTCCKQELPFSREIQGPDVLFVHHNRHIPEIGHTNSSPTLQKHKILNSQTKKMALAEKVHNQTATMNDKLMISPLKGIPHNSSKISN